MSDVLKGQVPSLEDDGNEKVETLVNQHALVVITFSNEKTLVGILRGIEINESVTVSLRVSLQEGLKSLDPLVVTKLQIHVEDDVTELTVTSQNAPAVAIDEIDHIEQMCTLSFKLKRA